MAHTVRKTEKLTLAKHSVRVIVDNNEYRGREKSEHTWERTRGFRSPELEMVTLILQCYYLSPKSSLFLSSEALPVAEYVATPENSGIFIHGPRLLCPITTQYGLLRPTPKAAGSAGAANRVIKELQS